MYILWYALVAFFGGVVAALVGWLDSHEDFNTRKFMSSVLRALVAGVGFAIAGIILPPTTTTAFIVMLLTAFATGAGIDVLGNRIAGAIKPPTPPPV